jgi:hypothetical protein
MKVVIIGLYNSGSSIISRIMMELGFDIGYPLWDNYEPQELRDALSRWWDEPNMIESEIKENRVRWLREWGNRIQERSALICVKHPLLCLSAYDICEAWGDDIRIIRAARPIEKSIRGLCERKWFPSPVEVQQRLYNVSQEFFEHERHLEILYSDLLQSPRREINRIIEYLNIAVNDSDVSRAAGLVRRDKRA